MASKLCCTAEQDGRPDSPELPNARVSEAAPQQPLLKNQVASSDSRFTSAQSDDLHELRQIFDNAQDGGAEQTSPVRAIRTRSSRPSIYSLRSLHKMASMRSILRRKFSRDLNKKSSNASVLQPKTKKVSSQELSTIIKHPNGQPNSHIKVTKDDLRKDLLSDKKPAEGGYDSDAEVLDNIARNVSRNPPSKRPSIHSVDWSPSAGSKSTPGSSTQRRNSTERKDDVIPYHIPQPKMLSFSSRFTQVFSTPNLRPHYQSEKDRSLRRSHSATSVHILKSSPVSPLRLPSLTSYDKDGVSWSEIISESLRLSQFPVPPRHASLQTSETALVANPTMKEDPLKENTDHVRTDALDDESEATSPSSIARAIDIRVQQPTSITSPRPSTSVRGGFCDNVSGHENAAVEDAKEENVEVNSRRSVHLYSMRIGHHLRSGSLLSWNQPPDAPDIPPSPQLSRSRAVSDMSQMSLSQRPSARHERQTSSSGFASSKVPSKWGTVLAHDREFRADVASSIYSSRPQSPPESFGGSLVNLSQLSTAHYAMDHSSTDLRKLRRSSSFPTDNEDTPRPLRRYEMKSTGAPQDLTVDVSPLSAPILLARKNSVAETKKSKFREEFSPSPPRKKATPTTSIIKFFNPKRLSMRSQSDANLEPDVPKFAIDGFIDTLPVPASADRERRQSRSMQSFQAEQDALGKSKGANHVWDDALKAHQAEKASMFLPQNKDLAVRASPFRERSGSIDARRPSFQGDVNSIGDASTVVRNASTPITAPREHGQDYSAMQLLRRNASAGRDDMSTRQEISNVFDVQGDGTDVVGAWGRYPSHSRNERTLSAGKPDSVEARDFALEAAMRFAMEKDNIDYDDLIGPTERLPTSSPISGERKQKKKFGSGKVVKSNSMTFGRKFIKNYYSGIFKSSSYEFQRYGRGHRSSIASGGTLEHPELELLPEVFMGATDGAGGSEEHRSSKQIVRRHSERQSGQMNSKLVKGDSMATLRPRRNSSTPNFNDLRKFHDGADDSEHAQDRARVWSVYYETCVPSFPRLSTDAGIGFDDHGSPSCKPFDHRHTGSQCHIMPKRPVQHSRNASQLSRKSILSQGSARRASLGDGGDAVGRKSLVSVRHSTMDLISKVREQEMTEHARILSLTRAESRRGKELTAAL